MEAAGLLRVFSSSACIKQRKERRARISACRSRIVEESGATPSTNLVPIPQLTTVSSSISREGTSEDEEEEEEEEEEDFERLAIKKAANTVLLSGV